MRALYHFIKKKMLVLLLCLNQVLGPMLAKFHPKPAQFFYHLSFFHLIKFNCTTGFAKEKTQASWTVKTRTQILSSHSYLTGKILFRQISYLVSLSRYHFFICIKYFICSGDYEVTMDGIYENFLRLSYHDPMLQKTVSICTRHRFWLMI
jgi:hypothetical protein